MSLKKPIVYVLGVEGHFFLAQAMKETFDRPVIGIISCERVHEMMTPEREAIFDKIYSLPDLYVEHIDAINRLSIDALNEKQSKLEEKLGVYNTPLLTYSDRRIRRINDYRKVRDWQLLNLMLIDQVLSENDPAFIIDGVVIYLQMALRKACEKRDVPYLLTFASRSNSYAMYRTNGQQVGMQNFYELLENGEKDAVPAKVLKEADAALQAFIDKPTPPGYAIKNSEIKLNWPMLRHKLAMALDKKKFFMSERVRRIDIGMNAENGIFKIAKNVCLSVYRKSTLKAFRLLDDSPDMDVPFVYVPLHYTPENSDLYFGPEYDHHESFITHLAKYMPSDCILYVKEHTSMPGRRPVSFYQNLAELYNVKLIAPSVSTFKLIKKAKATITVTGTPGWESFLLGKPTVAFGNVFFNFLPGILHTELKTGFDKEFKEYIDNFKPDSKIIKNAYRAYHASTFQAAKVDIGYTSDSSNALEHALGFCMSVKATIEIWHKYMQGKFDASLWRPKSRKKSA